MWNFWAKHAADTMAVMKTNCRWNGQRGSRAAWLNDVVSSNSWNEKCACVVLILSLSLYLCVFHTAQGR